MQKVRSSIQRDINISIQKLAESDYSICSKNKNYWYTLGTYQRYGWGGTSSPTFNIDTGFPVELDYVSCLKNAADSGNVTACYDLMRLHLTGNPFVDGVTRDLSTSQYYLNKGLDLVNKKLNKNPGMIDIDIFDDKTITCISTMKRMKSNILPELFRKESQLD